MKDSHCVVRWHETCGEDLVCNALHYANTMISKRRTRSLVSTIHSMMQGAEINFNMIIHYVCGRSPH